MRMPATSGTMNPTGTMSVNSAVTCASVCQSNGEPTVFIAATGRPNDISAPTSGRAISGGHQYQRLVILRSSVSSTAENLIGAPPSSSRS